MRRQGRECACAARAAWIPAAVWALMPVLSTLPSQPVQAQQSVETSPPLSRPEADEQIASLLGQVEALLYEGHVTSPAGGNASDTFSRALIVSSFASPEGVQAMANFPSVLKKQADAEQAAGHADISMRYEIFAEVVSSILGSRDAKPNTQSTALPQAEPRPDTTSTTGSVKQETATTATRQSDEAVGDDHGRSATSADSGASGTPAPSKASMNVAPQVQTVPLQTKPTIQQVPPPVPGLSSHESPNAPSEVGSSKSPGTAQVATLPPASEANALPAHDAARTPEPNLAPLLSQPMIGALLEHGDAMLSIGDISAAKLLFARAAKSGSGKAAVALGDTYNPIFLVEHGVLGSLADPELAKAWYRKGLALGEPQARERLIDLGGDTKAEAAGSAHAQ